MDVYRTPDEQFDDLPGYSFAPRVGGELVPGQLVRISAVGVDLTVGSECDGPRFEKSDEDPARPFGWS